MEGLLCVNNYPEELSENAFAKISSIPYMVQMYRADHYCTYVGTKYYMYRRRSQSDFEDECKKDNLI